ncbi:MAG: hypothetical protein FJY53_02200 [Betaproteobacteria bacterium]|nr:hypothetical protein [Betaproteobacteria bacterium]
MSSFSSSLQWGTKWTRECLRLFKLAPGPAMLVALAYVMLFILSPAMPNMAWLSVLTVVVWPVFMVMAVGFYRNLDTGQVQSVSAMFRSLQPVVPSLFRLGFLVLLYIWMMRFLLSADIERLPIIDPAVGLTEAQAQRMLDTIMPLLIKSSLLLLPVLMATWFSPMLLAYRQYKLFPAIKHSVLSALKYMLPLSVTWLLLTAGIAMATVLAGVVIGLLTGKLAALLLPMVVLSFFLLATTLMMAFQYITYRDIFR